jgi:type IV secretory pathway VirB2 component (pilin)
MKAAGLWFVVVGGILVLFAAPEAIYPIGPSVDGPWARAMLVVALPIIGIGATLTFLGFGRRKRRY